MRKCICRERRLNEFADALSGNPQLDDLMEQVYVVPITDGPPSNGARTHDVDCPSYVEWRDLNSFVYFVTTASGPVKIGSSSSPFRRIRSLQTGHHEQLELLGIVPGGEPLEQRIHESLLDHRLRGEWFRPHEHVKLCIRYHLDWCIACGTACEHHEPSCVLENARRVFGLKDQSRRSCRSRSA